MKLSKKMAWAGRLVRRDCGPSFGLVGPPGTGKSLTLQMFMGTALFNRGHLTGKAVLADVKGDALGIVRGLDPKCPTRLTDPSSPLVDEVPCLATDFCDPESARTLAGLLLPSQGGADKFWDKAARQVVAALWWSLGEGSGGAQQLNDLIEVAKNPQLIEATLMRFPSLYGEVSHTLSAEAGQQSAGVLASIHASLSPLSSIASASARVPGRFSLKRWVKKTDLHEVLILSHDPERSVGLSALNRIYMELIAQAATSLPETNDETLWCFLDELPGLGIGKSASEHEPDAVMRLLMQCRSKGARVVIAMQDVEGCARVYGSREQAFSLLNNCASLCFTAPLTHLTETYMKAAMGSQQTEQTSRTVQSGAGGGGESTAYSTSWTDPISTSAFSSLGAPSKRNGIAVTSRAESIWCTGRIKPRFISKYLRPVDRRYEELARQRRPAQFSSPKTLERHDLERLRIHPPTDGPAPAGLFGATPPPPF